MSKLVQLKKLAASERWIHFLESTAMGLQLDLTLLFPEPLSTIQVPIKCPVCEKKLPMISNSEVQEILNSVNTTPDTTKKSLMAIHPLRDGLVMVARGCHCILTQQCSSIEDHANISGQLLASFQAALTESLTGGQRATELSALRHMNQIVLSIFQGSSEAIERTYDLILSALVILSEGQGGWLEYEKGGTGYRLVKGDEEAVDMFLAKRQGKAETILLTGKFENGRLGVLSPVDQNQTASILSLFAQELVIISEIAELFRLLQDHFGQVLGCIRSSVFLVNNQHKILYANAAAANLLGCKALDLLGKEASDIDAPWTSLILASTNQCVARQMDPLGPIDNRR